MVNRLSLLLPVNACCFQCAQEENNMKLEKCSWKERPRELTPWLCWRLDGSSGPASVTRRGCLPPASGAQHLAVLSCSTYDRRGGYVSQRWTCVGTLPAEAAQRRLRLGMYVVMRACRDLGWCLESPQMTGSGKKIWVDLCVLSMSSKRLSKC